MATNDFPTKKRRVNRWVYIVGAMLLALAVSAGVFFYKESIEKESIETVEIPLSEAILLSKDNVFSEMQVGEGITLVVADDLAQRASVDIDGEEIILKGKQKVDVGLMRYELKDLKDLGFVMPPVYKEEHLEWWKSVVNSSMFNVFIPLIIIGILFVVLLKAGILTGKAGETFRKDGKSLPFSDIGGVGDAKDNLMEAVSFLRDKKYLQKVGAQIPHGILLSGAPGVGKTMLAKAMASEADVPFYFISGSELQSHWFGLTAQKIKKMFKRAKSQPSIVFIDEIDSIAQKRSYRGTDVSRDNDMTMNQLLAEMDGFDSNSNILVIAATNHAEVLDPALLRQGRFDRQINIPLPDFKERIEILAIHSKDKPVANDVRLGDIAKSTSGMSGADLAGIWNEASIIAGREHKESIDMMDINRALDRILAGCERKGTIFTEKEKRIVAYHEAGHALVASLLPECDKVQRVSILPHGNSGGFTRLSSEKEERLLSKTKAESAICMMIGGRIAEELAIGDISNGAANDLMQANQLATEMVERYGMGEKFGLRCCVHSDDGFRDVSHETAYIIERDVESLLKGCYDHAKGLIEGKMTVLKTLADRLVEVEVVDADELDRIIDMGDAK